MAKKTTKRTSKKKKKGEKFYKNPLFGAILGGVLVSIAIIFWVEYRKNHPRLDIIVEECDLCNTSTLPIKSTDRFRDWNPKHFAMAQQNGLKKSFANKEELEQKIDSCLKNGLLVKIRENRYYVIKDLTHSHPYLTPEAAKLLDDIGILFQQKLREKKLGNYRFRITSLLRTVDDQRRLACVNRNATPNGSAHYFGTTFDIGYYKYEKNSLVEHDPYVEEVMKETLRELRLQCRFLIVNEGRSKCFHITTAKCKHAE